jgi:hypothetical protein
MPAIDLARLRKQANRLADFFFLPEEFIKHLREILEFYINYTLRTKENIAPGSNLITYRTPPVVLRQIENEIRENAAAHPPFALELADMLWDEGALETRLLAAYILGCIPPAEEHLLPRITAWTQQIRDPQVRSALLTTSLARMRKETPRQFLSLVRELLHPARTRTWSNGIHALLPMIADSSFENFPPILDAVEHVIQAAPSTLQTDIRELIVELYKASPSETTFFLKQILEQPESEMTVITLRRIAKSFPPELQDELKSYLRPTPIAPSKPEEVEEKIIEPIAVVEEPHAAEKSPKKTIKKKSGAKPKSKGKPARKKKS